MDTRVIFDLSTMNESLSVCPRVSAIAIYKRVCAAEKVFPRLIRTGKGRKEKKAVDEEIEARQDAEAGLMELPFFAFFLPSFLSLSFFPTIRPPTDWPAGWPTDCCTKVSDDDDDDDGYNGYFAEGREVQVSFQTWGKTFSSDKQNFSHGYLTSCVCSFEVPLKYKNCVIANASFAEIRIASASAMSNSTLITLVAMEEASPKPIVKAAESRRSASNGNGESEKE